MVHIRRKWAWIVCSSSNSNNCGRSRSRGTHTWHDMARRRTFTRRYRKSSKEFVVKDDHTKIAYVSFEIHASMRNKVDFSLGSFRKNISCNFPPFTENCSSTRECKRKVIGSKREWFVITASLDKYRIYARNLIKAQRHSRCQLCSCSFVKIYRVKSFR